jgi:hypothetical protein
LTADSESIATSQAYRAPHVMLRVPPEVRDGAWVMRFGGVSGRGETPALAAAAFDDAWFNQEADA